MSADLFDRARAWIAEDPDDETRAELEALLVAGAVEELADRFAGTLQFGTAGLRGRLGAGPNRMNRVVVQRAAAGLASWLLEQGGGSVVIGYDARRNSDVFARDTAEVVAGAGLEALLLPAPLPTPVLAFAVRHLGCAAGVMVTASHNPPEDNGYKVYDRSGSQIVAPTDVEISARIEAVGPLEGIARSDQHRTLGPDLLDAYLHRATVALAPDSPRDLTVAYTPLHGVGRDVVLRAFARARFDPPHLVTAQAEPDPAFPTVAFPNPEEPGAIDLALATGRESGADIVLANDPDADRCAVAVPLADGEWRMLTGDEVGALLAAHLVDRGVAGTYACSIVSSSLLGSIARAAGQPYAETLTGFKWIARVPGLAFGYEEALGYCVDPGGVRDKDGVTAALAVAELAASLKASGRTLLDRLDDLMRDHGLHATGQLSVRVQDLDVIAAAMARLRAMPPGTLGGFRVVSAEDLADGSEALPPTDGLRYRLESDRLESDRLDGATFGGDAPRGRVIVRPSGTEPKLKCYLEVVLPPGSADLEADRRQAADLLSSMASDLSRDAGLGAAS